MFYRIFGWMLSISRELSIQLVFPHSSVGKESACNAGELGLIPGLGRDPGERKGYPLQYSGLENSTDCIVYGIAKSQTWLSDFHFQQPLSIPKIAQELEKKINDNRWEKMKEISGGKDPGVRRKKRKTGQRIVEEKVRGMFFWEETRIGATWGYWLKSWNIKGKKTFKGDFEEVLLDPV